MARCHFRTVLRQNSSVVQNARIQLFQHSSTTPVANAWTDETGGTSVAYMLTNAQGEAECWLDTPQAVDVYITDNGATAYYPISPTSLLSFPAFTEFAEVHPAPVDSPSLVLPNSWTAQQSFSGGTVGQYDILPGSTQAEMESKAAAWRSTGGTLRFLRGTHTFTADIQLPTSVLPFQIFTEWVVEAEPGAYLTTSTADVVFFNDSVPVSAAAAAARTNRKLTFRNLVMVGSNGSTQGGIRTIGTYGLVIENCIARFVGTGFDQIFALMGRAVSCITSACVNYGFRSRSAVGIIGDATHPNSASNHMTFHACRDYATTGMTAQFDIIGSNGNVLYDCITEGGNPVNAIRFDKAGNTTCQFFGVSNWHPENFPTNSHLYLTGGSCRALVERVVWTVGAIMIDASSTSTSVIVRDCPYLAGKFRHHASSAGGTDWVLDFLAGVGADAASPAVWDGVVPAYRSVRRFAGGSDGVGGNFPLIEGAAIYIKTDTLIHLHARPSPTLAAYWGPSAFATWTAAPVTLRPGDITFYRDESGNKLKVAVMYADGTTIKTGEIALT